MLLLFKLLRSRVTVRFLLAVNLQILDLFVLSLLLLKFSCVFLLFDLHHQVSSLNSVLFPFLVPTPLVNLSFTQICSLGDLQKHLFSPEFVLFKRVNEHLELNVVFSLTFSDDSLHFAGLRVDYEHTALGLRDNHGVFVLILTRSVGTFVGRLS